MQALIDFDRPGADGVADRVVVDVVAVQGTIAAGKSTLIARARGNPRRIALELGLDATQYTDALVLPEPLHLWRTPDNDVLTAMYADARAHGLRAQTHMARTRLEYLAREIGARVPPTGSARLLVVIERSPTADRRVFAANMHEAALFDDVDWLEYCEAHERALRAFRTHLVACAASRALRLRTIATLVLHVGVDAALARIRARGRECEIAGVTADALVAIDAAHRRVFGAARWLNTERVDPATLCSTATPLLPPACARA